MRTLTSQEFRNLLRRPVSGCFLFYGDEEYMKQYCLGELRRQIFPDESAMLFDLTRISATDDGFTPELLSGACAGLPMSLGKCLIELHSLDFTQMSDKQLSSFCETLSEITGIPVPETPADAKALSGAASKSAAASKQTGVTASKSAAVSKQAGVTASNPTAVSKSSGVADSKPAAGAASTDDPEYTPDDGFVFVIYAEKSEFDGGDEKRPSAAVRALSRYLTPVCFDFEAAAKLSSWTQKHFLAKGVSVSPEQCRTLVERCGRSMTALTNEIDKLSAYTLAQTAFSSAAAQRSNAASGNAASGNAASGNAASGNAASGNAASVNVASGNAASGNAASGNAASGNTASGNAASGNAAPATIQSRMPALDDSAIEAMTPRNTEFDAFALSNAIMDGRISEALAVTNELRRQRERPEFILGSISRTAGDIYSAAVADGDGLSSRDFAAKMKMHEYKAGLCYKAARRVGLAAASEALLRCSDTDMLIKTTSADPYSLIDTLICSIL